MGRRKLRKEEKKSLITKETMLSLLKMGALVGIALAAPGAVKVLKGFSRDSSWDKYYGSSIERTTGRLLRMGFAEVSYEGGQPVVKLTKKGQVEILRYNLDTLQLTRPLIWDGKWRVVTFDIPERDKKIREAIRLKLQELKFYQFQESVFITPYPCEKEISYLREILNVPHEIKLLRADWIENDAELRRVFEI